jgi:hypothetical protein
MASKFKVDLKKLMNKPQVENLSKHLTEYDHKVKELVKELNLKSRDAREKGKVQLDRFTAQVQKTRTDVEKNVKTLLQQEGKVLNQKVNELVTYLKGLAANEKKAAAAPVETTKKKTAKAGTKKAGAPRARAKKAASATEAPPSSSIQA